MTKAKRAQSRPLPTLPPTASPSERAAEPTQDTDPQNWLADQLKRVEAVLAIPYPATSREIRLRAVQAQMLIAQIAATLDTRGQLEGEDDGENRSTLDEL